MANCDASQLREAVKKMRSGTVTLAQSVPSARHSRVRRVWEGVVHVFDLAGHPTAPRAMLGHRRSRATLSGQFFAVLHWPPVDSPQAAVRAAMIADHTGKTL